MLACISYRTRSSHYFFIAHPYESGDLPENYEFKFGSHERFEERIEAAESLNQKFKNLSIACPLLVDFMDNKANKAYGALPERLYVLFNVGLGRAKARPEIWPAGHGF